MDKLCEMILIATTINLHLLDFARLPDARRSEFTYSERMGLTANSPPTGLVAS